MIRSILLGTLFLPLSALAQAPLDGGRVMVLGDSITAAGHYVSYVEYLLNRQFPETSFDIVSIGLGSETASGLSESDHPFPRPCVHERLGRALKALKPSVVLACYGMNDGIYHPQSEARLDAYIKGMEQLDKTCREAGVKEIIFMTPPPYDPTSARRLAPADATDWSYKAPHARYHEVLEDYARWIKQSKRTWSVDFNTPMTRALRAARVKNPAFSFSGDGIHPDRDGHLLMAKTLLRDLKIPFADADRATIEADPLFTLVENRRRSRSHAWLRHVGFTRGKPVAPTPLGTTEETAATQQAEIDALRKQGAGAQP